MKNHVRSILLILVAGLFYASSVLADIKVGFVNAARVIEEAPQAESARNSLEREFAPRDRQLGELQKAIIEQEEKLSRDGAVMSESGRKNLEREIRHKKREFKRAQDEFREDFNIRRNEVLADLQRQAVETIQAIAKGQNYDLILTDGVLYASDKVDITQDVINRLRREFKK
jgi:outer membrane protein